MLNIRLLKDFSLSKDQFAWRQGPVKKDICTDALSVEARVVPVIPAVQHLGSARDHACPLMITFQPIKFIGFIGLFPKQRLVLSTVHSNCG